MSDPSDRLNALRLEIPHRCASCGSRSFDATGACTRCNGVFVEPDYDTLIARVLADECADHAALIDAVKRCRVRPMDGAVWIAAEDWERVMMNVERRTGER